MTKALSRLRSVCATAWLVIALGFLSPDAKAATVDKQDLFTAGTGDYAFYRIPGIVVTAEGTILAYCEARRDNGRDWSTLDVLMRRSTDGGKTWSEPFVVSRVEGPKHENPAAVAVGYGKPYGPTYNNPTAIADRDGSVHLTYCLEYMRCFYSHSRDDGRTFSEAIELTAVLDRFRSEYDWKSVSTGPGHGIQLRNGRLLVGVRLADAKGRSPLRHTAVTTIYSDDGGDTWERGEIAIRHGETMVNPNEPIVVELSDGRVMMNVRNESKARRRLVTFSDDGATNWTEPYFDSALLDSGVMASIVGLPDGTIVFANPDSLADRSNLTVQASRDEGATWETKRTLEAGPSAYSDLAVRGDGTILCLYERGSDEPGDESAKKVYGRITLAKFDKAWVYETTD